MAAYGEDSSRSALTFIPPVTLLIVSRPLESPRILAYETFRTLLCVWPCLAQRQSGVWSLCYMDEPEIGDMDEGVVEGSEDAGDAEDGLT